MFHTVRAAHVAALENGRASSPRPRSRTSILRECGMEFAFCLLLIGAGFTIRIVGTMSL